MLGINGLGSRYVGLRPFLGSECFGHAATCRPGLTNQNGVVTAQEDGTYFVVAAGQNDGKPGVTRTVRLWLGVNGKDIDNSNCEQSILDPALTTVLVSQGLAELKKGDKVEVVSSGTVPGVGLIVRKPTGEPVVPRTISQPKNRLNKPAYAFCRVASMGSMGGIRYILCSQCRTGITCCNRAGAA